MMIRYLKSEGTAIWNRLRNFFCQAHAGRELCKDLIGVLLLCLFTALLCTGKAAALESYLEIALASFLLFALLALIGRVLGCSRSFIYPTLLMIAAGLALQILLFSEGKSGLGQVHFLILFGGLGLVSGALLILSFRLLSRMKRRWSLLLLTGCTLLIYLLLLSAGIAAGNTKAWLMIGSFSFQPTELTKVLGMLTVALVLTYEKLPAIKRLRCIILTLLLHTVFLVLINELGTLIILALVSLILSFIYLPNTKQLLFFLLIMVLIATLLLAGCYCCHRFNESHPDHANGLITLGSAIFQKTEVRLKNLLDPEHTDPYGAGYQSYQVRKVLSTAKFFGCCPQQTVPVIDSDFIFIYLISHFGIFAAMGVTLLLILMTFEGSLGVLRRQAGAETAAALAFMLSITVSSILSALSSLCLLPTIGVGFSFLSRGGTAAAVNHMILIFILYGMRQPLHQSFKRGA